MILKKKQYDLLPEKYKEYFEKLNNFHCTVKPLKLNQKIFELFKIPDKKDMKVYIPFAGTFSEVIGILANGIKEENVYVCELSDEYIKIGKARLDFWKKNNYNFKNLKTIKNNKSSNNKVDKVDKDKNKKFF